MKIANCRIESMDGHQGTTSKIWNILFYQSFSCQNSGPVCCAMQACMLPENITLLKLLVSYWLVLLQ